MRTERLGAGSRFGRAQARGGNCRRRAGMANRARNSPAPYEDDGELAVDVTQAIIDEALAERAKYALEPSWAQQGDPLGRAIWRAFAGAGGWNPELSPEEECVEGPWVDADWALLRTEDYYEYRWTLPPDAIAYYQAWDRGETVAPASFTLPGQCRYISEEEWYREQGMVQDKHGDWVHPADHPELAPNPPAPRGAAETAAGLATLPPRVAAAVERAGISPVAVVGP